MVSLERSSGAIQWKRAIKVEEFEKGHGSSNAATATATTDGKRVYAYFGSHGLLCYEVSGKEISCMLETSVSETGEGHVILSWNDCYFFTMDWRVFHFRPMGQK